MNPHQYSLFPSHELSKESRAFPCRQILSEILDTCAASRAVLYLISASGDSLDAVLDEIADGQFTESALDIADNTDIRLVAATGMAIITNDHVGQDDGLESEQQSGNMIVAPVYLNDEITGVLCVLRPVESKSFTADELDLVSWKANLVSIIIKLLHEFN